MKIKILRSAVEDLAAGRAFYEGQSEGVGDYFADCMFAEIDSLALHAGHHRLVQGFHRIITRKFPYAIYYKISGETALVYRVLDCRRNPQWIGDKLQIIDERLKRYRSGRSEPVPHAKMMRRIRRK